MKVLFDKGLLGEFYTYECLKPLDGYKRYLFNLYVPKDDGETTELDVVLLHESGVYVLEFKNYSGKKHIENIERKKMEARKWS